MTSLSFPDMNVWLALATPEHVHAGIAKRWWDEQAGEIAFCRFTQMGFLRLMTTDAVMDGKPLTMDEAWGVYDRWYDDDRVTFVSEPADVEGGFRERAKERAASPKVWADAWLLAFSATAGGKLITLDKALGPRGAVCLLGARG
jgi:toxin-antitoxin system PIN domain toxin